MDAAASESGSEMRSPSSNGSAEPLALRIAPGAGHLARRRDALLFLPGPTSEHMLAAFMNAPLDSNPAEDACAAVVDALPRVPAFALVSWFDDLQVLAFGELELRTNQPELPMVSGLAEPRWVTHTVRPNTEVVRIAVQHDTIDGLTDLTSGIVPAAGFDLALKIAAPAAQTSDRSEETWPPNVRGLFDQDSQASPPSVRIGDETLLLDQAYLIGRKPDPQRAKLEPIATLTITDEKLSRNHLVIENSAGTVMLSDCGSLNGTVVMHHPAADPHRLAEGETIALTADATVYLGDQILRLEH